MASPNLPELFGIGGGPSLLVSSSSLSERRLMIWDADVCFGRGVEADLEAVCEEGLAAVFFGVEVGLPSMEADITGFFLACGFFGPGSSGFISVLIRSGR